MTCDPSLPAKRRRGGQPGNSNAVKTGLRSAAAKAERAEWKLAMAQARDLSLLAGQLVLIKRRERAVSRARAASASEALDAYDAACRRLESMLDGSDMGRRILEMTTNEYGAAHPNSEKSTNEYDSGHPDSEKPTNECAVASKP